MVAEATATVTPTAPVRSIRALLTAGEPVSDVGSVFSRMYADGLALQGRNPDRVDFGQEPLILHGGSRYPLHAGQREAWESDSAHVAAIAGSQAGKTCIGPYWVLRELQRAGGGDFLVVGPTFPLMDRKLVPECKLVWESQYRLGEYKFGRRCFEFSAEGLRRLGVPRAAVFFGFAEDPDSLESMTAVGCWRDETGQSKFTRAAAEAIDRRLAIATKSGFGRILDTTTPYEAGGWYQTDVWDKRGTDKKILHVVSYRSEDNPTFPKGYVDAQRAKGMPEWRVQMMYYGQYTRPAGAVYDNFDRKRHVVPHFWVPPTWRRYYGIDFGQVHTAVVCAAEHPTEKDTEGNPVLYVYHEHFPNKASYTHQHVKSLKAAEDAIEYEFRRHDPSFRGVRGHVRGIGGSRGEKDPRWEWTASGITVEEPWVKDVETGIDRVYAVLSRGGVKVMDSCVRTISQLESYSWELDDAGEPVPGKIKDKNAQHLADSVRYVLCQLRPNSLDEPTLTRTMHFGESGPCVSDDEDEWAR